MPREEKVMEDKVLGTRFKFDYSGCSDIGPKNILYIPVKQDEPGKDVKDKLVVGIGAHPDDIELGAAISIDRHIKKGVPVYLIIASNGQRSKVGACNRLEEQFHSAKKLGVSGMFLLGLQDTKIGFYDDLIQRLEKVYEIIGMPTFVYSHSNKERHQDHVAINAATSPASRKAEAILLYSVPSSLPEFAPHYFTLFNVEGINRKWDILRNFKTQIDSGIIHREKILAKAIYFGEIARTHEKVRIYAEAFEQNHIIKYW